MNNRYFLLFLFICSVSVHSAEVELNLQTPNGDVRGSLLIPDSKVPVPVVLIIPGSGPTDRNGNNPSMTNNSLQMLATELQKQNIASLRYDKRGIGKSRASGQSEADLRFEHYIDDAEGWVNQLGSDSRFSEVIVIGHSEGSLIGMIASQNSKVSKFISLSGAGRKADELLLEQLAAQPKQVLEPSKAIIESLNKGELTSSVDPMLHVLFRPSVQPYLISWFSYDPEVEVAKLEKPVLVIHGTADIQISTDEAKLLSAANANSKLQLVEGMNHILKQSSLDKTKNVATYNMPDLPIHGALIQEILDFI